MASKKKPSKRKELEADDYLAAAQDHAQALAAMYMHGDYAITIYTAGLAAECLFRAFREKNGLPFTSDHHIEKLADEAGFPDIIPDSHRERFNSALADVIVCWRNNHRFRSREAIRRFLKGAGLDRGVKGDYLKENARRAPSGAVELVGLGVQRWQPYHEN